MRRGSTLYCTHEAAYGGAVVGRRQRQHRRGAQQHWGTEAQAAGLGTWSKVCWRALLMKATSARGRQQAIHQLPEIEPEGRRKA